MIRRLDACQAIGGGSSNITYDYKNSSIENNFLIKFQNFRRKHFMVTLYLVRQVCIEPRDWETRRLTSLVPWFQCHRVTRNSPIRIPLVWVAPPKNMCLIFEGAEHLQGKFITWILKPALLTLFSTKREGSQWNAVWCQTLSPWLDLSQK